MGRSNRPSPVCSPLVSGTSKGSGDISVLHPFLLTFAVSFVCYLLSDVQLFATLWTVACQAHLSMGFSRPKYWSGLPFLSPGDLPYPGIEPGFPALQADSLLSEPSGKSLKL